MNKILMIGMVIVLVAPSTALADKKKANTSSGKDTPTESINLNYSKTQFEYTNQQSNPKQKSGINGGSANKGGARH